ncbi:MAG: Flp pilus assembly complex ATPase component [bacterium]|nr:Flp pilus assembly complex ATPase component [bacterium]
MGNTMSAKTIAVFSNKGGVGKTFTCVNLAATLALEGKKVLLCDLDFSGQDIARMLNLSPHHSLADLLTEIETAESPEIINKFITTHSSGLHFLPAVTDTRQIGDITPDNVKSFFKRAPLVYDYVIVDGGASFNETLITVLDYSNLILLAATPDILAVYQVKWGLEVLKSLHFPMQMIKLVLNRAESRGGVAWQEVRTAVGCDLFSLIPSDGKAVGIALNRGVPCVVDSPRSKIAEVFNKMAKDLSDESLFVQSNEVAQKRATDDLTKPGEFWEKLGISQRVIQSKGNYSTKQEDKVISLKKRIHEKLVEQLNLQDVTPEALSDPAQAKKIRTSAESIVSNLLAEESGVMISSHEDRSALVKEIVDESLGLGPLEDFLADQDVTDIMANSVDELYVEKNGKLILTNKRFLSATQMRTTIDRIIAPLGRRIDESVPMVDARLPDGSRINAIIPPLSLNGPMITIRKFGETRLTVENLLKKDSLTQDMADFLSACVITRKNIIVSGGTGAGKTTLLNIISSFIPNDERIITIEDAAELKLNQTHWARLESRPPNVEGKGAIVIRDLFINSLRMRPDRIIIGECRGPEVLDMLQAMNTGHNGSLTTLHANSTHDVLSRMSSMMLLSGVELPIRAMYEMIASAIEIVVHVARLSDGARKITGVTEVTGSMVDGIPEFKDIFVFEHQGLGGEGEVLGVHKPTGYVPVVYHDFITRGIPIKKSMFDVAK